MSDTPYERILKALNIEQHLTGRQLARLLHPEENAQSPDRVYWRIMKSLQKLESQGLLKSDSYGVKIEGKEKLWRILASETDDSPKYRQKAVLEKIGVTQTAWKIHASLYEHEKLCGDIFVSLAVTGQLWEWGGEGNQEAGFRHDRSFKLFSDDSPIWYLEVETGSQKQGTWRGKIENYTRLFRETQEPFNVLFSMPDQQSVEDVIAVFGEYRLGSQYAAAVQSEFVAGPLKAVLTTRHGQKTLSNYYSKYIPNG